MNRRVFVSASATALASLQAMTTIALAQIKGQAAQATPEVTKPDLVLDDYSPTQAMYLATLFTWLEMLEASIDPIMEGIELWIEDLNSIPAMARAFGPLGVWSALDHDSQPIAAPSPFEEIHGHALDALSQLGLGSEIFRQAIETQNATAISIGAEYVSIASDHIELMTNAMPWSRPLRSEVFLDE